MVTDLAGAGTPETRWQAWGGWAGWPELDLTAVPARVVVVAPHPDDEVLGVGGLLSLLATAGTEIHLVAVSDGEASHPGSPTLAPADLVEHRDAERRTALSRLGLATMPVHRLRLPDGGVAGHTDAVVGVLAGLLDGDTWCLATWRGDGHPDHEAVGRAAADACAATGARLLEYPVWTWHWAEPGDPRVPWARARRVPLPESVHAAKFAAVDAYETQVRPLSAAAEDAAILPPAILARLTRDVEVVFG